MLKHVEDEVKRTKDDALKLLLKHIAEDEKKHHEIMETILKKSFKMGPWQLASIARVSCKRCRQPLEHARSPTLSVLLLRQNSRSALSGWQIGRRVSASLNRSDLQKLRIEDNGINKKWRRIHVKASDLARALPAIALKTINVWSVLLTRNQLHKLD